MQEIFNYLKEVIGENEFFQGGLVLGGLSFAAVYGKSIVFALYARIKRIFLVNITIDEIVSHILFKEAASQIFKSKKHNIGILYVDENKNSNKLDAQTIPDYNVPYFQKINGARCIVRVGKTELDNRIAQNIKITTLLWNKKKIFAYMLGIINTAFGKKESGVSCYYPDFDRWERSNIVVDRKLDSVALPEVVKNKLLQDINQFTDEKTKEFYSRVGIPYKRGYLLHGPPGNGKTSLIKAIATHTNRDVYILNCFSKSLTERGLQKFIRDVDDGIIIIEDIDTIFDDRNPTIQGMELTYSGFLNSLDGISSFNNGLIYIISTNHIDKLDPALLREGRLDLKIELKNANREVLQKMSRIIWNKEEINNEEYKEYSNNFKPYEISCSKLQKDLLDIYYKEQK